MNITEKKQWIESKIGKGLIDGLDDDAYEFYYRAMHDEGFEWTDADRWAWLNTLFGYEIPGDAANDLINCFWDWDDDVLELKAEDKERVRMAMTACGWDGTFDSWCPDDETPKCIKFSW